MTIKTVDIVFDGPPGPEAGRFVEVEQPDGSSIKLGEWVERDDGFWVLRIPDPRVPVEVLTYLEQTKVRMYDMGAGPDGLAKIDALIASMRNVKTTGSD